MDRKKILAILSIILVFFPALLYNSNNHHTTENTIALSEIKSTFDTLLYKFPDFEDELPINESMLINMDNLKISEMEKSLIIEDIDYLFSLFKYGYSGYEFFGGDEAFTEAKENILWSIYESYENKMSVDEFLDVLYGELNFIQDSHLLIGHYQLCQYSKFYSSRNLKFYRDKKGYYTNIDNENLYLLSVDGNSPDSYMKLTLDKEGDPVYNLGMISSNIENVSIPLNLVFKSKNNTLNSTINLFEYIPFYKKIDRAYNYYEIDNIPVLEVNSLCRISPDDFSIESFLEDSKILKDKENLIIDLRGNSGGSMINIDKWYKGFTGEDLQRDMVQSGLYTNTSTILSMSKFEHKDNEHGIIKDQCVEQISSFRDKWYFPGWSPIKFEEFIPPENNTNIYILMDKSTSSAAEFFAYYLRKLNNVKLVGTNSNGCTLTGNCNTVYLPNSRIKLHISHKLYINKEFENTDGLGLLPDLWIKPELSMDRIIKYIKKKK